MLDRQKLINQETGELDWSYIKMRALARADWEFGGPGVPNSYVRDAIGYFKDVALADRIEWRKANGLSDDTEYSTMTAYAPAREGVRRSAF